MIRPNTLNVTQPTVEYCAKIFKKVTSLSSAALQQFFLLFFPSAFPSPCKQQSENHFVQKRITGNELYSM